MDPLGLAFISTRPAPTQRSKPPNVSRETLTRKYRHVLPGLDQSAPVPAHRTASTHFVRIIRRENTVLPSLRYPDALHQPFHPRDWPLAYPAFVSRHSAQHRMSPTGLDRTPYRYREANPSRLRIYSRSRPRKTELFLPLWNRVIAVASPRAAPADSPQAQPAASQRPISVYRPVHVLRAGGLVPAGVREQAGECHLVGADEPEQRQRSSLTKHPAPPSPAMPDRSRSVAPTGKPPAPWPGAGPRPMHHKGFQGRQPQPEACV